MVSGISPAESNVVFSEGKHSVVGDGDSMCVGTEIAQHVFRTTEGRLGIDDPVLRNSNLSQNEKTRGSASVANWPWNSSVPLRKAVSRAATNVPRKTRLSTLTGGNKGRAK